MTVFNRGALAFALAAGAIVLANCGGGGSGPAPGPTPYPISSQKPLPTPTSGPTATPTPRPQPSRTPRPSPTPSAHPSPSGNPSPTPSPSPTATPPCNAPPPDPHKSNSLLTGHPQEVEIPCFKSFRAAIKLPDNNGGGSSPIDVRKESSTDKTLGAPSPAPGTGTALFYEAVRPSNRLVLRGTDVTFDMSSEKRISPDHTYAANFYLRGAMLVPTVTGLVPIGHNLYVTVSLPPRSEFPAGEPVQIVLYESS